MLCHFKQKIDRELPRIIFSTRKIRDVQVLNSSAVTQGHECVAQAAAPNESDFMVHMTFCCVRVGFTKSFLSAL